MRHYKARQREDGRWDYTSTLGHRIVPIGYCAGWREYEPDGILPADHVESLNAERRPFRDSFHTDGHETADEARECYRQYLLDLDLRFIGPPEDPDTLHRCEAPDCDEFTAGHASVGAHWYNLCAEHRTRDVVDELLHVGESWQS